MKMPMGFNSRKSPLKGPYYLGFYITSVCSPHMVEVMVHISSLLFTEAALVA